MSEHEIKPPVRGFTRNWRRRAAIVTWALLLLPMASLAGPDRTEPPAAVTVYEVKGVFVESRDAGKTAVIAHENIPGYMEAMTMPFQVKAPAEVSGLQPGDKITFWLSVTKEDGWIDEIKKVAESSGIRRSAPRQASPAEQLGRGAMVPDFVLTNQAGQTVHLKDFKGQAVALTFFFSRCPLPTLCPRMNNNFAAVQAALQADVTRTNWQLFSVSFDPGFDTPEYLGEFAKAYQSDPSHWSFATSSSEVIRKLGGGFGLSFWRENGSFSHNLRTAVLDASGRVQRVFTGNEWKPAEMVVEMKKAMAITP